MQTLKNFEEAATTNYPTPLLQGGLTKPQKIKEIAFHFRKIMEALGLDLSDDSLQDTPERVARMYVEETFKGLDIKNFPKVTATKDTFYKTRDNMILCRDIKVHSMCEHHFVPMVGSASVAYLSGGKILGLSKMNRIVDYFCKRPQLQERLTAQIADCLSILLDTDDVAVLIKAKHFCVATRGIQDTESETVTHLLNGKFRTDPSLHKEFLDSGSYNCH